MEIFGFEPELDLVNTGFLVGTISSLLIFYVEVSLARNVLGFLIGSGFSPVFTTDRTDSSRFFCPRICFCYVRFDGPGRFQMAFDNLILHIEPFSLLRSTYKQLQRKLNYEK